MSIIKAATTYISSAGGERKKLYAANNNSFVNTDLSHLDFLCLNSKHNPEITLGQAVYWGGMGGGGDPRKHTWGD